MSFLYPAFLFALAAIAIPIIIHLFNFRRYKTIYFSNVKFLRDVKEKTDARSRLKHLLILLCRILAITFLVFAFAQPYIKTGASGQAAGRKAISIFIDNSFSMGQLSADVPLLEQAKLKALQIAAAYGPDDQYQLLTENFEGRHQRLVDQQEMFNLIKEVQLSPYTKKISEIISRQKQALQASNASQKVIYLLSDYQKNFSDITVLKTDTTFQINFIPLRSAEHDNVYIDTCWLKSPVQVAGQSTILYVQLTNNSQQAINNGRLTLSINNEIKAISNFSVNENSSVIDTIVYTITDKGWNQASLSIVDHPITFDDTYYFTYEVAEHLNVMIINESNSNPYLDALFGKNDFFITKNLSFNQLNYSDLPKQQLVILDGLKNISSGLAAELKKFVTEGGNLVIFPDQNADVNSYNQLLQSLNADPIKSFSAQKKMVNSINTQDQIFNNVFQQIPQNLSLPQVSGNFDFAHLTSTNERTLMAFSDGSPLLSKYSSGSGLLYVSAVPLDKNYTDLPVNPLFAPMMYNMALSKESAAPYSFVIGSADEANVQVDFSNHDQVLQLKGAQQEFIPQQRVVGNRIIITLDHQISQSGFYSLQDQGGNVKGYYAINYDRKESDLKFLTNDELKKLSQPLKIRVMENSKADLTNQIAGQKLGLPLWKVSVIFTLLFIALEILLLKFWK